MITCDLYKLCCHLNFRIFFFKFGGQNGTDTIENISIGKGAEASSLKYYFKDALSLVYFIKFIQKPCNNSNIPTIFHTYFVTYLYNVIIAALSRVHIYAIFARFFSHEFSHVGMQEQNCTSQNHHNLALD